MKKKKTATLKAEPRAGMHEYKVIQQLLIIVIIIIIYAFLFLFLIWHFIGHLFRYLIVQIKQLTVI